MSHDNKVDELTALVYSQCAYWECSLLCFMDTWLNGNISDSPLEPAGFILIQVDRGKREEEVLLSLLTLNGVTMDVISKWCYPGYVAVRECTCTPDNQLMAVKLRLYFLPQEFSHSIVVIIYTVTVIYTVIVGLQTRHPSAPRIICRDFNHVSLSPVLTNSK